MNVPPGGLQLVTRADNQSASVHVSAHTHAHLHMLDSSVWTGAPTYADYIAQPIENADLWRTTTRLARLSPDATARAAALTASVSLLVLVEDWCGDAMHSLPYAARIAESNPRLAMRVVRRDLHPALMESHLTGESRSVPVIIAFDALGHERGWWGPRPSPLQQWVLGEGTRMDKPDRYKAIRTWYARDRGATVSNELLLMLEGLQDLRDARATAVRG